MFSTERCRRSQNISGLEISCPNASFSNVWDSMRSSCSTGLKKARDSDYCEFSSDSQRWAILFRYQRLKKTDRWKTWLMHCGYSQHQHKTSDHLIITTLSLLSSRNPSSTCLQLWLTSSTGPSSLVLLDFWTPLAGMFSHLHTVCTLTYYTLNTWQLTCIRRE